MFTPSPRTEKDGRFGVRPQRERIFASGTDFFVGWFGDAIVFDQRGNFTSPESAV